MKVIINNKPSNEALRNCAKVLEEIVMKELIKQQNDNTKNYQDIL